LFDPAEASSLAFGRGAGAMRLRGDGNFPFPKLPAVSHWPKIVLYVQNTFKTFYFRSSCSRDDERSEESCEHDDWPTTEIVSIGNDRS
jgi:hypothetical protein